MIFHKITVFYLIKLGQIVLIFPKALQHHCNKLMRYILTVLYLANASFYYNDAPTARAAGVLKNKKAID